MSRGRPDVLLMREGRSVGAMNDLSFMPQGHLVEAQMNNHPDCEIEEPGWVHVIAVPE